MAKKNEKEFLIGFMVLTVFIVVGTFIGVMFIEPKNKKNKQFRNKQYTYNFNETYRGIVVDKLTPKNQPKPGLKQSLVTLKLNYSTIKHFDPRDSLIYFDCLIDYPNAQILMSRFGSPNVGDSFIYEGIKDLFFAKVPGSIWYQYEPNVTNINNKYVEQFFSIPKYTKQQLKERKKAYPKPFELPNDYYMLLFGKFRKKERLAESYKKLSSKSKYKGKTISKYFEKRFGNYYFFLSNERYGSYDEVYTAWKEAGYSELYIAKFDKHNKFIKVLEKQKKK